MIQDLDEDYEQTNLPRAKKKTKKEIWSIGCIARIEAGLGLYKKRTGINKIVKARSKYKSVYNTRKKSRSRQKEKEDFINWMDGTSWIEY